MKTQDSAIAQAVRQGLSQKRKQLPAWILYDDVGSKLFDAICFLPYYHVYRAEIKLLPHCARYISSRARKSIEIIELGVGSGEKTGLIVRELMSKQRTARLSFIDISRQALEDSRRHFSFFGGVKIRTYRDFYLDGFRKAVKNRSNNATLLVLLLGSNIGNLLLRDDVACTFRMFGKLAASLAECSEALFDIRGQHVLAFET